MLSSVVNKAESGEHTGVKRILIVEDDRALSNGIALALRGDGMQFTQCHSLSEARGQIAEHRFQLILLDVNLPDGNGFDFLAALRETDQTPVILLTANDLETDIVAGLSIGADDYIVKPFSLAILRARVEVQLRRSGEDAPHAVQLGAYRFDFDRLEFWNGDERVELSKTEQKLLRLLVENRGSTVPRERLLDRVWTDGAEFVDENALSVAVNRLRGKLNDKQHIKTVYGVGYQWTVKQ